jgi:hypothetical protein
VVDAYLELLASDRALLVPILGSLADMPLDFHDKGRVIDATQVLCAVWLPVDVVVAMVSREFVPWFASRSLCWERPRKRTSRRSCRVCSPWRPSPPRRRSRVRFAPSARVFSQAPCASPSRYVRPCALEAFHSRLTIG